VNDIAWYSAFGNMDGDADNASGDVSNSGVSSMMQIAFRVN
jgi:hypothetical protein